MPDSTAFEVLLRAEGQAEFVAASDAKFFAREQTLEDTFWEQWTEVKKLDLQTMHRALRESDAWLPGIEEGVALLRDAGLAVHALTDQPTCVTDFLSRWGFGPAIASPTTVDDGRVTGIDPRFDKLANLQSFLAPSGRSLTRIAHVGNGANDVPVWKAGVFGFAVFADPETAKRADIDLGRPQDFVEVAKAILAARAEPRAKPPAEGTPS